MESVLNYYGVDWLAMILTFFSIYLLGNKNRHGFILGMISNVAWFAFGVMAGSVANPIANIVFITLNWRGYRSWKTDT